MDENTAENLAMVAQNLDAPDTLDLDDDCTENTLADDFVCLSYDGEVIDSDTDLDALLARLVAAIDPRYGPRGSVEEVVVWKDAETVAAILQASGRIIRLDSGEPVIQTPTLASGKRSRGGRPKQRPHVR